MPHAAREARREYERRWKAAHPERVADYKLRSRYGIDTKQYDDLWVEQLGLCPVCGRTGKLVVDHDHETGAVRGLIHQRCNSSLGGLGDTIAGVERALGYLRAAYA